MTHTWVAQTITLPLRQPAFNDMVAELTNQGVMVILTQIPKAMLVVTWRPTEWKDAAIIPHWWVN